MYKIQKLRWFFYCLSPYSKDSRKKQREQILWGLQYLFWPARAKLIICAADSEVTFLDSSPHPLNRSASFLRLCLFNCLSFSIFYKRFWTPTDVFILLHVCSFLTSFHICASLFSPSFPFLSYFSFIPSLRALLPSSSTLFFFAPHETQLSLCLF